MRVCVSKDFIENECVMLSVELSKSKSFMCNVLWILVQRSICGKSMVIISTDSSVSLIEPHDNDDFISTNLAVNLQYDKKKMLLNKK